MRRRIIGCIILALGILSVPFSSDAQQPGNVPRIGVLGFGPLPSEAGLQRSPFLQELRTLGWVEGQNLVIER